MVLNISIYLYFYILLVSDFSIVFLLKNLLRILHSPDMYILHHRTTVGYCRLFQCSHSTYGDNLLGLFPFSDETRIHCERKKIEK